MLRPTAVLPPSGGATTTARSRPTARRGAFGLLRLGSGRREQDVQLALAEIRRDVGGLRQVSMINPRPGSGKTTASIMLGLTFGQARGAGQVLAWDGDEEQAALTQRCHPARHARTAADLLADLSVAGSVDVVDQIAAYVRGQGPARFDVLAAAATRATTSGTGGPLAASSFRLLRQVVARHYPLLLVDTGDNVTMQGWQAAVDATDQLVLTVAARSDSAETAARFLDHLDQTGRRLLGRRAVAVVSLPRRRMGLDLNLIEQYFSRRCRAVLHVPYDRQLAGPGAISYDRIAAETRRAWLRVAAAIAEGL